MVNDCGNMKRKNKVFVINYEHPPIGGGGGRVAANIAKRLSDNYDITIFTAHYKGLPKGEYENGYRVRRIFAFRTRPDRCAVWQMFMFIICGFFPILFAVLKEKPFLIHCHFAVPSGVLGYVFNKLLGIQYIITLHGGDVPALQQAGKYFKLIKVFTYPIWKNATKIIAVSEWLKKMAQYDYPRVKVEAIPNGCDTGIFFRVHQKHDATLKFLFVGRLSVQKDPVLIIEALNQSALDNKWVLHIVGDGPLLPMVKQKVVDFGFQDKVVFHGWREQLFVRNMMQDASLLLMPSIVESSGLVALESISCGTPVICSDIPPLKSIIHDTKCGVVLGDWKTGFLEAVKKAMACEDYSNKVMDWRIIADRYKEVYSECICHPI